MKNIAGVILALFLLDGTAFGATKPFMKVDQHYYNATTFPRGVRNIGMGGAGAADISGFSSGYFNPASFGWSDAITLGASTNDFAQYLEFVDTRLTASHPLKNTVRGADLRIGGSLAYSTLSWDLGCERTIYSPVGCTETDNPDYYLSGSLAAGVKKGMWELALGGTAKYLEVKTFGQYMTWAFDLGFIAAANIEQANGFRLRPRIGASVRNLGKDIEFSSNEMNYQPNEIEQPGEHRYGIGVDVFAPPVAAVTTTLRRNVSTLGMSIDYDIVKGDGSNQVNGWAFGAEMSFFEMLRLRAGRSDDVFLNTDCMTYGIGLGWDFRRLIVQFDYARIDRDCDACELLGINPEDDAFGLVVGGRF
ncbi:MAG TPA: hypothetical protein VMT60_00535 [Candidatus Bathyarchaeia archaeon]|nr:hypothetical protein [Candidatus Bathyarchaeia archaeon]